MNLCSRRKRISCFVLVVVAVGCGSTSAKASDAPLVHEQRETRPARTTQRQGTTPHDGDRGASPRVDTAAQTEEQAPLIDPRHEDVFTPIEDPSGRAMRTFHSALRHALDGQGQVRVAWWGASHTAADLWSGHVRRVLQDRYGEAGHGFLLPFRWHGGYRHQDVNIRSSRGWKTHRHKLLNPVPIGDYGYGGVAISSNDPTQWFEVATTLDNKHGRRAATFEVWMRRAPTGGTLVVEVDGATYELASSGRSKHQRKRRARKSRRTSKRKQSSASAPQLHVDEDVLFYRFELADRRHKIRARPKGNGDVLLYGVVLQRENPGVIVDQMGIPGMRGKIHLHWRESTWRAQLRRRDPHLVILAYGTNAAGDKGAPIWRFRQKWRRVLERLRAATPTASCLLVGPTDRPLRPDALGNRAHRPRIDAVIRAQKRVAAEYGCGFWDAFDAMGGRGSMKRWVHFGLGRRDYVHLSAKGYELKAERFLSALVPGYRRATR